MILFLLARKVIQVTRICVLLRLNFSYLEFAQNIKSLLYVEIMIYHLLKLVNIFQISDGSPLNYQKIRQLKRSAVKIFLQF